MSQTKPLTLESFSRYQLIVIGICWLITLMNGFCILAISFTAPVIAKDWSFEPAALGVVLGASFVGMALGSLALAPLADYVGRRWIVLGAVGTLGVSMLLTAVTHTVPQLTAARFLTGFAEGTMLPSMTAMVAEYSPDRRRNLSISIMQIAYPLGGTAAGFLTIYLMQMFRWTSVFVGGGASTLAVGALALVALRHLSAFGTQMVTNLEPVYAIVLAIVLLGEQRELDGWFYAGVVVILSAVFIHPLLNRQRRSTAQPELMSTAESRSMID